MKKQKRLPPDDSYPSIDMSQFGVKKSVSILPWIGSRVWFVGVLALFALGLCIMTLAAGIVVPDANATRTPYHVASQQAQVTKSPAPTGSPTARMRLTPLPLITLGSSATAEGR